MHLLQRKPRLSRGGLQIQDAAKMAAVQNSSKGLRSPGRLLCRAYRTGRDDLSYSGRRSFGGSRGKLQQGAVLNGVTDLDGPAADLAILDVGLAAHRRIENHRNFLSAIRTGKCVLHETGPKTPASKEAGYNSGCHSERSEESLPARPREQERFFGPKTSPQNDNRLL